MALASLTPCAFAQSTPPSAASQLQSIPQAVPASMPTPAISIEPATAPVSAADAGQKITVRRLQIDGAQAFSETQLLQMTGFVPGSELSLADLQGMADAVTQGYRRAGYLVAQAILPAQTIENGVVNLRVTEGRYGQITVRNQSRLADSVVQDRLLGLSSGDAITMAPLDSRLLLLSDVPGVAITSTLAPGSAAGTSDLLVDVIPGKLLTGSVDADNAGNRYTGYNRLGATINLNNPAGRGDVASLRVLTSGKGLNYARASYQMPFGKLTAGVAYSWLGYELGREFSSLQATGNARIASLYASYPLLRSRNSNLSGVVSYDAKSFHDRTGVTGSVTDRKAQAITGGVRGEQRDDWGLGGVTGYSALVTAGTIDIRTPTVLAADSATARSNGRYAKLGLSAMRLQNVTDTVSLYAGLNGQLASKNLDVSEKMQLGGFNGVRAYPEGEAYADEGYVLTLEARLRLAGLATALPGQVQLVGFVDTGSVTINKNPWAPGVNRRSLSGAGVGLDWSVNNDFLVRTAYAVKLGSGSATSAPDRSGRFWIQAIKYF